MLVKLIILTILTISLKPPPTEAVIEDIIDILALTKEVIKTVAGTWEIVEQTQLGNDIDLPFLKRKEQKIIQRMSELSNEIRNTEMMVNLTDRVMHAIQLNSNPGSSSNELKFALFQITNIFALFARNFL
jgi:hypothetical protein